MKVGVGLPRVGSAADAALMAEVEGLGFDYLACGEHVMFHVPARNAVVSLACAAGATSRIQLLSATTLVPLYPAVLLAKLAAALDDISGGRFTLGVGVGGEYPTEFEAVGVDPAERGRRTDEALDLLRRLWSGEPLDFAGRYTSFTGGQLQPRPARARLPVWSCGRSTAARRRAARVGDGWMPYMFTPQMVADGVTELDDLLAEVHRPAGAVTTFVYCLAMVSADGNAARRIARETAERMYRQDMGRAARYFIAGTPAECVTRLREYAEAGASGAVLNPCCPDPEYRPLIEVLAAEVLPALR